MFVVAEHQTLIVPNVLLLRSWCENTTVTEFIVTLGASKHSRTKSSIWHIRVGWSWLSEFGSSAEAIRFCLSAQQFQRTPWITQEAMLPSGSRRVGELDRYFAKLIELRRRSVQSQGTSALLRAPECLVNRKYVELHSARQKVRSQGAACFPDFHGYLERTHARENLSWYSSIETATSPYTRSRRAIWWECACKKLGLP